MGRHLLVRFLFFSCLGGIILSIARGGQQKGMHFFAKKYNIFLADYAPADSSLAYLGCLCPRLATCLFGLSMSPTRHLLILADYVPDSSLAFGLIMSPPRHFLFGCFCPRLVTCSLAHYARNVLGRRVNRGSFSSGAATPQK